MDHAVTCQSLAGQSALPMLFIYLFPVDQGNYVTQAGVLYLCSDFATEAYAACKDVDRESLNKAFVWCSLVLSYRPRRDRSCLQGRGPPVSHSSGCEALTASAISRQETLVKALFLSPKAYRVKLTCDACKDVDCMSWIFLTLSLLCRAISFRDQFCWCLHQSPSLLVLVPLV